MDRVFVDGVLMIVREHRDRSGASALDLKDMSATEMCILKLVEELDAALGREKTFNLLNQEEWEDFLTAKLAENQIFQLKDLSTWTDLTHEADPQGKLPGVPLLRRVTIDHRAKFEIEVITEENTS